MSRAASADELDCATHPHTASATKLAHNKTRLNLFILKTEATSTILGIATLDYVSIKFGSFLKAADTGLFLCPIQPKPIFISPLRKCGLLCAFRVPDRTHDPPSRIVEQHLDALP